MVLKTPVNLKMILIVIVITLRVLIIERMIIRPTKVAVKITITVIVMT